MVSRARVISSRTATHRKIGYGVIAAFATIALAPRAGAQPAPRPARVQAHLTVDADEECASAAAVAARVQQRSRRIEFVSHTDGIPSLRVAIRAGGAGDRVAELAVQWPDGRRSERQLSARGCAAALDALALLVAMALDPAALGEDGERAGAGGQEAGRGKGGAAGKQSGGVGPEEGPGPGPSPSPNPRPDPSPSPSPNPEPDPEPEPEAEAEAEPGPESESGADSDADQSRGHGEPNFLGLAHVAVGASAQLVAGLAPRVMPGVGLYALLALNGDGPWAPAVELQVAHAWAYGLRQPAIEGVHLRGDADFELQSARLDACPLGLQRPPFAARACVAGVIGRLVATGSDSYSPQSHAELWASLGGSVLVTVGLGDLIELQAGFGAGRPLRRYDFAFRPDVFHRVPGLCFQGHLGAGVRFP
jgi:hypothetical protein